MSYSHEFNYRIENNFSGYEKLISFYNKTRILMFDNIQLDFNHCTWFEANLSAVLGAIISKLQYDINSVHFDNLPPQIESILSKNTFLSNFGGESKADTYGTTVPYRKFQKTDQKIFTSYISNELLSLPSLPVMSEPLKKKIKECILEIFINAQTHGNTSNIFSCGQFYPKKGRVDFSIVNLGSTIQKEVSKYFNQEIQAVPAIQWAIEEGHTTRTGNIPGGIGLSTLLSFIQLNKGKVQIVSGDGYWQRNSSGTDYETFQDYFDGTIVNIEFNVNDTNSYILSGEESWDNIF